MKARWKSIIVAGAVLAFFASDVMAQGWGGGRGRGWDGPGGPGMGFRARGQRPMGPGGPQGGPGAWCPLGRGQGGSRRLFARRRRLADEQMQNRAGQSGRRIRRPGAPDRFGGAMGGQWQRGAGRSGQMRPGGRGRAGRPFAGGPGAGWAPRSQRRPDGPGAPGQPPAGDPRTGAGRSRDRGIPPLEQMFDKADANQDGALTKEEIRTFQEARRGNRPSRQP